MAKLCGKHLGYPKSEHPVNVAAWFRKRMGYWPREIVYPAGSLPMLEHSEHELLQLHGVTLRESDGDSPLALAGPIQL